MNGANFMYVTGLSWWASLGRSVKIWKNGYQTTVHKSRFRNAKWKCIRMMSEIWLCRQQSNSTCSICVESWKEASKKASTSSSDFWMENIFEFCKYFFPFKNWQLWKENTSQQIQALAKPESLSLFLRTYMVEGENRLLQHVP